MTTTTHLTPPTSTNWGAVLLLVGSGIVAALQVGKAAIAAPMLQSDFGLDLTAIGWLTGVFAVIGLVGGMPAGACVASLGGRRILLLGLLTTAAGAALGALAASFSLLLLSRIVEGAGFLLIVVAAPSLLDHVAEKSRRDLAFALWSCFMPAGIAIAMLSGPLFDNWRAIWWAGATLALVVGLAVIFAVPQDSHRIKRFQAKRVLLCVKKTRRTNKIEHSGASTKCRNSPGRSWRSLGTDVAKTVQNHGALALAAAFALYSLMFFALFSFLPVLLMERLQVTHQTAGLLSALATAVNILGNLAAGFLLSWGVGRPQLLAAAGIAMGLAGLGIFLPVLSDAQTFMLCVLFSAVGGLIPATLLATAPLVAPVANLVPVVVGLIMQGSNLGQIIGPVAVGSAIQSHGWSAAAVIVAVAAVLAAAVAAALGRILRRAPEGDRGPAAGPGE